MTSVFVSSTVYDLIDIRAEVQAHLVAMGLRPMLSDHPTSDFQKIPDANSIETCLINVRESDYFVLILDQRYGRSLKSAGFEDVSATHLELKTAEAKPVPIYAYARDRLVADYAIWKRQGCPEDFKGAWLKDSKDLPLLRLLEEHSHLENSNRPNWYTTFRDSLDLKAQLTKDFKKPALHARLVMLTKNGLLPAVRPHYGGGSAAQHVLGVQVFDGVACTVQTRLSSSEAWKSHGDLSQEQSKIAVKGPYAQGGFASTTIQLFARFETVLGDLIEDRYEYAIDSEGALSGMRIASRHLLGEVSYLNSMDDLDEQPA